MSALPQTQPDPTDVLTRAVLRAGEQLGIAAKDLARILGVSRSSLSRMTRDRRIEPDTKEGELALLFLRVFRSLDAFLGGHRENCRRWLNAYNHHLAGVPAELLTQVTGLVFVAEYLDAMRGRA
jgi:transcriptional regulator with XRE-family HTH domain